MRGLSARPYFAYGANLDPEGLARRVGGVVRAVGPARAPGWAIAFDAADPGKGRTWATLVWSPPCETWGILYDALTPSQLSRLDAQEDVYERRPLAVDVGGIHRVHAQTYLAQYRDAFARPPRDYVAAIHEQGRRHGFPWWYLGRLPKPDAFPPPERPR